MKGRFLTEVYKTSLALLTDLYQLTMAQGYWKLGIHNRTSCFYMCFRRQPFQGSFAVFAGLQTLIEYIENFRFTASDIEYLKSVTTPDGSPLFQEEFLKYLEEFTFTCDLHSVEEGTVIFPYEPMIRVTGPLLQAQLLESPFLNLVNFQTLIATKSARICKAAYPGDVLEFGVRRAQGIDGALSATRSAYIGGCKYTSNVLGGKLFNIPVSGTHAHSWVMSHKSEEEAFKNFAQVQPGYCVFLVDTYNTVSGTRKAIEVAKQIKKQGIKLLALRLDSGDLAALSIQIRQMLDEEGLQDVKIMATNELDENIIRDLKQQGACIDIWGVGTNLVTGKDQPAFDGVYKLSAIQDEEGVWQHTLKISENSAKVTDPGILQTRRYENATGVVCDVIYDELLGIKEFPKAIDPLDHSRSFKVKEADHHEELMKIIYKNGKCLYKAPSLEEIRIAALANIKKFPPSVLRFLHPQEHPVGLEESLYKKKMNIIEEIKSE